MPRRFAEISFTPSVKATQQRYGTRQANERFEQIDDPAEPIGPLEAQFIAERDGFYQATVNESGWPYVQFRGGPVGFLKVVDGRTIGYADFRGNLQYLSVGNLVDNDRIAMILMDYANQRRLKVWARAKVVHYDDDPELVRRFEIPTYRARVERAIVMTVDAVDWNCPQHITPRFTQAEVEGVMAPLRARIAEFEAARGTGLRDLPEALGDGPLELVVTGIRQLTSEVRAYELRRPDHGDLPDVAAGSHIDVPVLLGDGSPVTRTFSISSNPNRRDVFEIAVRLDPDGGGGTRFIHENYRLGLHLRAGLPRNAFRLHSDSRPALLIAGGIGITPLKAMGQALLAEGREFSLHYAARSRSLMAYRSKLAQAFDGRVSFYAGDEGKRLDIEALLSGVSEDTVIYVCGPARLIEAVRASADDLGIDPALVRSELFTPMTPRAGDATFPVKLARSGLDITVGADQAILDAVLEAGVEAEHGCRSGTCGACAVKVLEGAPLHRDSALSDAERDQAGLMCPCVSRAGEEGLVLDL